ncbi:MAG: hypothetical protein JNM63_02315, partial [Spirochaetia bacterium]|nr:hypothetical protein [Spirochaetia bacterium]
MRNVEFAVAPEVCGGSRPVGGLSEWQRDLAASTFPETKLCALIEARPGSGVSQLFDPNAWDEVLRHLTEKLFIRVHSHGRLYRLRGNRFGVIFRDADLPLPEVKAWLCPTNRPVHLFVGGYSFSVRLVTGLVRCPPSRAGGQLSTAHPPPQETKK